MEKDQAFYDFIKDGNRAFKGWDFSFLSETGRTSSSVLSWSYGSMAIPLTRNTDCMLDMGTGGGEFLSLLYPLSASVFATEGYEPNVAIAKKRLEPLGVQVTFIEEDNNLPFADNQFSLILNRHESYSPFELRRILNKHGVFLTQQVGVSDCAEINKALGVPVNGEFSKWNLQLVTEELENHDFQILFAKEEFPVTRFYDIGALIYYLHAISWQVPGFSVSKYEHKLFDIHQDIQKNGYFEARQHRFIVKARKM